VDPGYITVFLNGVLVQDHTPLEGPGGHMARTKPGPFPAKGPLTLQDHGNPMRFRNIWYRSLPPRPSDGGTDGWLSTEATMAKRQEIAATIRQDAAKLQNPDKPMPELLRLLESLVYEKEEATLQTVEQMATRYADGLKSLPADKLAAKKDEARQLRDVFNYLVRGKILPETFPPKASLEQTIKDQGWDKKPK
jgi:hypothetical protein